MLCVSVCVCVYSSTAGGINLPQVILDLNLAFNEQTDTFRRRLYLRDLKSWGMEKGWRSEIVC